MNGNEFLKRLKRLGKRRGIAVRYETHGKGSHGRVYFGDRFATLKDPRKEIGRGLFKAMCRQLGVDARDVEG